MKEKSQEVLVRAVKTIIVLMVAILVVITSSAVILIIQNNSEKTPEIKIGEPQGELPKSIGDLTLEAVRLARQAANAPTEDKFSLKDDLNALLTERKNEVFQQIQDAPQELAKNKFPASIKQLVPAELQELIETEGTYEGILDVSIADDFENNSSETDYLLETMDGQVIELHFAGEVPNLYTGTRVRVSGVNLAGQMSVETGPQDLVVLSSPTVTATVAKKIAVILFNFDDNRAQPYTPAQAKAAIFTDANSTNRYYQENSFNQWSLEGFQNFDGDVYGWYTLDPQYNNTACQYTTWPAPAMTLAAQDGYNQANYTNTVFIFPGTTVCTWSGKANPYGNQAFITWEIYPGKVAHELGHNYGLHHAANYNCVDSSNNRVPISNNCTIPDEYGDPFDVMGNFKGAPHMSNFNKGKLGWWNTGNTLTVTQSGTYSLSVEPVEKASTATTSLRIRRSGTNAGDSMYYYVEFRQPHGTFDQFQPTDPVVNGVTIRLAPEYTQYSLSRLLDMTPLTTTYSDAALLKGQTFTDEYAGITITTSEVTTSSATLQVQIVNRCYRQKPTVTLSPSSQWGNPGQSLTYSLSVKNNDSTECGTSTFNVSSELPTGWSQSPASPTFQLSPGATSTINVTVTSASSAAEGAYSFNETAVNSADSGYSGTASASYNILNAGDTTPPVISISYPPVGSSVRINNSITITTSASDNVGVAKVNFLVNGKRKCSDISAPFTCTWKPTGKVGSQVVLTAIAYDAAGNSASSMNTVTLTAR